VIAELFKHPCGVDVDDEEFAGTFAGSMGGYDAVDVLRRTKARNEMFFCC